PASKPLLTKIEVGSPPRTVAVPRTHTPRNPRTGNPRPDWKMLAHSYAEYAMDLLLPPVAKLSRRLFQTPQQIALADPAALQRLDPEVRDALAHEADKLGQEPGYRKLSPRDQER